MYRVIVIPFLYICVLILLPLFLVLITPLLLYRRIVARLCQLVGGPSIGKILNATATSHACIGGKGSNILPLTVEGVPDLAHIKAQFTEKILNAKDPAGGDAPLYPELRQTIVSWGGYFFWADIPNFTLPIRLLDIDPIDIDSKEGINLLRTLYKREWKFGQEAFWELVIVPGVGGKFCVLFIMHHALADGFSMQKLVNKVSQPPIVEAKKKVTLQVPGKRGAAVVSLVKTLLRIPYDIATYLEALLTTLLRSPGQVNSGNMQEIEKIPNAGMTISTASVSLAEMKQISTGHAVSLSTLLISAVQGSIRKFGNTPNGLLYFPLPQPFHPEKLRNVAGMGYIELSQNVTCPDNLKRVEQQFQTLKVSTFPGMVNFLGSLSGSLPPFLLRRTISGAKSARNMRNYVASIFVVYRNPFHLFGYPVVGLGSCGSGLEDTNAIAFFIISSHDKICISVMGDSEILTEQEGKSLLDGMLGEVELFRDALDPRDHVQIAIDKN